MSDVGGGDSAISPATEGAVPAYVEMLRTAIDQGVPQQEIDRWAALLAEDHGLDWTESGIARVRASLTHSRTRSAGGGQPRTCGAACGRWQAGLRRSGKSEPPVQESLRPSKLRVLPEASRFPASSLLPPPLRNIKPLPDDSPNAPLRSSAERLASRTSDSTRTSSYYRTGGNPGPSGS